MQVVINVPERIIVAIANDEYCGILDETLYKALKSFTPLPKGHGRLIDADSLTKNDEVTEWLSINPIRTGKMLKAFSELFIKKVNEMPTIIEADGLG